MHMKTQQSCIVRCPNHFEGLYLNSRVFLLRFVPFRDKGYPSKTNVTAIKFANWYLCRVIRPPEPTYSKSGLRHQPDNIIVRGHE